MKKRFLIATIVASIGLVWCGSDSTDDVKKESNTDTKGVEQSTTNENTYEIKDSFAKGVVDSIVDGDSLYIDWSEHRKDGLGKKTLFELECINAPEITHNIFNKMPYAEESKKNLEDLVSPGDEVYIEFSEDGVTCRAFIYVKTGDKVKQLNNEQIKSGLAYTKSNKFLSKGHENIAKLEETENLAKKQSLGIWLEKDFVVDGMFNKKYVKEGKEELYEEKKRDPEATRITLVVDQETKKSTVLPND